MQRMLRWLMAAIVLGGAFSAGAQVVDQARGADPRVDYPSLVAYGPWDDRNYDLTLEDLALLAPDEDQLHPGVPAFYRVELRRRLPDLPRTGASQYPRRTLPQFFLDHGGFLVDGMLYRSVTLDGPKTRIDLERPVMTRAEWLEAQVRKALEGDARVTTPNGAAESAVAISPVDPDLVVAGSNGPGAGQRMHYSSDGGVTWHPAGALPLGSTCCDPTVGWSADGAFAYTATLGWSGVWFYRSADGGQTWDDLANEPGGDPRREMGANSADKEYLHVDTLAGSPCRDAIYMSWHENTVPRFARSTDFGHTWSPTTTISTGTDQYGFGSDIVSDRAGRVYYFWPAHDAQKIYVRRSDDCGASFVPPVQVATTDAVYEFPLPSIEDRRAWVHVAAAADLGDGPYGGSVYVAWTDSIGATSAVNPQLNHGRIQVAYSRDAGATWTVTTPHPTSDWETVDRWNGWLAVGDDGTVHVVFYDTGRFADRSGVDLVWARSADGGQTWSAPERMTSEPSPNIDDYFEFGDYNGLDVRLDRLVAIFTDNRDEVGGGGDSVDVYAAGAHVGDPPLFRDGFESGDLSQWSASVPPS